MGICSGRMLLGDTMHHFNISITSTTSNKPKLFLKFQRIRHLPEFKLEFSSSSKMPGNRKEPVPKNFDKIQLNYPDGFHSTENTKPAVCKA